MSIELPKEEVRYHTGDDTKITSLYYDGYEVLRTTPTGVKINWKAPLWRIAWGYLQYIYYSIKKWLSTPLRIAVFIAAFTVVIMAVLYNA